ncbi:Xanthine-guanine phosphoribosyltransferase [Thioalkalivibrio nitratireducens DSM 14787]|uniref:Xanthine-guanine phosphoribosyltransferase n=1 Tax=Thioalkalivibrio nitratireducens (strain DSM 14787 / UNIQEM 213 / ALEN2) TaxID=1255043 RepID=L0DV28_THIND|nr:Xanthine-guanine phosphoribosyltransferase [Thioalkalivibrio nitratireducens DSM 14787]
MIPVQLVGLDEVVEACDRLAQAVLASGFRPDTVVAVARGGFMPARFLCDFLHVEKLLSLRVEHYGAGAREAGRAQVTVPLSGDVRGAQVLVVDDVNDSGDTLDAALPHVEGFAPAQVRSAVLHQKAQTGHRADFIAREIRQWRWVLYPWAVVEDVAEFIRDMEPPPRDRDEICRRLRQQYGLEPSDAELDRVLRYGGLGP